MSRHEPQAPSPEPTAAAKTGRAPLSQTERIRALVACPLSAPFCPARAAPRGERHIGGKAPLLGGQVYAVVTDRGICAIGWDL